MPEQEQTVNTKPVNSGEKEISVNYRIRNDYTQNIVGDSGTKKILLTKQFSQSFATNIFNLIAVGVDLKTLINFKKNSKTVKFFAEIDTNINGKSLGFKIYFDVGEGEKVKILGYSFEQTVSTSMSLNDLDARISKVFEGFFNF